MDKSKLLICTAPIARDVTFSDGTTEKCFFRQVSGGEWRGWTEAERSPDASIRLFAMQRLIAVSLCEEDGTPVLTKEEAVGLTVTGIKDLFPHVVEVSRGSLEVKKDLPSEEATTSNTRSPSRSGSSSGKSTKPRKRNSTPGASTTASSPSMIATATTAQPH